MNTLVWREVALFLLAVIMLTVGFGLLMRLALTLV